MRYLVEISRAGLTAARLHPLRNLVTTAAAVAVMLPYLIGLGISRGIQDEAEAAIQYGADLYVTGEQFGRPVPIPIATIAEIRAIPGVTSVVPRIVGRIELGRERISAVVVGVALDDFPYPLQCVDGRLFRGGSRHELVIGSDLARRLNLQIGSLLPPFYRNPKGERVSEVVGIFRSDVTLWQARLIVTSLETASAIFNQSEVATDLLVNCHPGYRDATRRTILQSLKIPTAGSSVRPRVIAREDLANLLPRGLLHREGSFSAIFVLAFAIGILVILVTSGFGLSERRREIGILKATGWQTDELLLRSSTESLLLSVCAATISILLAFFWLKVLNGYGVAGVFLAGVDAEPGFRVPFRLTPGPALLAFLLAFVVVMSGSLYSTWRAATVPPREAIR